MCGGKYGEVCWGVGGDKVNLGRSVGECMG